MPKFLNTAAALAIAITIAVPANAQLVGGVLGGGGVGLPGGAVNGAGGIGVSGAVNGATGTVRTTTRVEQSVNADVKPPVMAVPVVRVPVIGAPLPRTGAVVNTVNTTVTLPAIRNYGVRRTAIIQTGIAPITYAEVPAYIEQQYTVLRHDLRGTGVRIAKHGQQIMLEMPSDVTFSFNKFNIQPRFYRVLNAVSRTLAKYSATYVDVNGHTDAIGSVSYNQRLSEKRSSSVADYLAAHEVNEGRLHAQGFGKTEPIASNASIAGRAANRRVEIILTPFAN